ncbi:hypothetical protein E2I00_005838, partial [Balaenoptera physalus]
RSQSGQQSSKPESLPVAPSNTQGETQNPSSTTFRPRVSPQDSQPVVQGRRVSIQGPLAINSHRLSAEDTTPINSSHRASGQDTPSITYSRRFHTRGVSPVFQTRHFSNQNPSLTARTLLTKIKSVTYNSQISIQPMTQSFHSSLQSFRSPIRARVDVPPSITHSPEASVKSVESIIWTSQESIKDTLDGSQINQYPPESNIQSLPSGSSTESRPGRLLERCRLSHSQLPMGWRLLHEAKKISRQLSLALSLAGLVIIGLICLGQPWIHFQVPLAPPGDPAGSQTIPINTIFFVRCSDISCLHEYDQNAYLLDSAWAFLFIASITSFILCIILINIIFFTSSNMPMLDFSNAHEHLQEGMTYELGCSFYLACIGVFLFLMTGFFSYLNYMNFWSLLAIQATWT